MACYIKEMKQKRQIGKDQIGLTIFNLMSLSQGLLGCEQINFAS